MKNRSFKQIIKEVPYYKTHPEFYKREDWYYFAEDMELFKKDINEILDELKPTYRDNVFMVATTLYIKDSVRRKDSLRDNLIDLAESADKCKGTMKVARYDK